MFNFDNLDDPKKQMMLMLAAGLLTPTRGKNFGEAAARGIQGGLMGWNNASQSKRQNELADLQKKMSQMQLDAGQRAMAGDEYAAKGFGQFFQGASPGVDQAGNEMGVPPSPPKADFAGYGAYLGANPATQGRAMPFIQAGMKDETPIAVAEGAALVDRRTNRPVFTNPKAQKPAEVWRPLTPEEAKSRGVPQNGQGFQINGSGQIQAFGSAPPVTNINMPKPDAAILKADEGTLEKLTAAAESSRQFANTTNIITNVLKGKGGGGAVKLGAETARYLGFKNDTVSANDLAEALNTRAAVMVRAPGSGQTSNIEFEAYKAAVPSLKNSEPGRLLMQRAAMKFAERDAKLADYARREIRKGTFSYESMAAFDESLGSVLGKDFEAFRSANPTVVDFNQLPR